eukprot:169947-Rhodomonas_salina.1
MGHWRAGKRGSGEADLGGGLRCLRPEQHLHVVVPDLRHLDVPARSLCRRPVRASLLSVADAQRAALHVGDVLT